MDTLALLALTESNYLYNLSTAQKISSQTLAAPAASVTFSAIPQTFSSLQLIVTAQSTGTGVADFAQLSATWNGIVTGYSILLSSAAQGGSSQAIASLTAQAMTQIGDVWNAHAATAGSGRIQALFLGYTETTFRKNVFSQSFASDGGTVGRTAMFAGANTTSTAAITSISLTNSDSSNFVTGSVFDLIGLP